MRRNSPPSSAHATEDPCVHALYLQQHPSRSGARITGKAASLLHREKKKYALATMCIGGGQGMAMVLEKI